MKGVIFALGAAMLLANALAWHGGKAVYRFTHPSYPAGACQAIDGDTIRCGSERIRLNGIDAPEMPGHCRRGRDCVEGDPQQSRYSLADSLTAGRVMVKSLKVDRYSRTVAELTVAGVDLSCEQLRKGVAIYKRRWDEGGALAAQCRGMAHDERPEL